MRTRSSLICALLIFILSSPSIAQPSPFILAYPGGAVPSDPQSSFAILGGGPWLADDGSVLFTATVKAAFVNTVFAGQPTSLLPVMRVGDTAPDSNGLPFSSIRAFGLSPSNIMGIDGTLDTPENPEALFAGPPGSLHLLAREGDAAPGGGVFRSYDKHVDGDLMHFPAFRGQQIDNLGNILFQANLGPTDKGTFVASAGSIYRIDKPAMASFPPVMRNGQLAFLADGSPGIPAVWFGTPQSLQPVIQSQAIAPDTGDAFRFSQFKAVLPTGNDAIALHAAVLPLAGNPPEPTRGFDEGIWLGAPQNLRLVVRAGDRPPDAPPTAVFDRFEEFQVNRAGQIAFDSVIDNSDGKRWGALYAGAPDSLRRITGPGVHVPGLGPDYYFGGTYKLMLNERGQIAFQTDVYLGDGSQGPYLDYVRGIWVTDASGVLHMVALEDRPLLLPDGTELLMRDLSLTGFNDAGQVAFASLGDAMFVWTVPEPSMLMTLLPLLALSMLHRRCRRT